MSIEFTLTKLIVADVEKLERFYLALGFKIVERRFGDKMTGSGDVAQEQSRLSTTGDATSHLLVLARFVNFPRPGPGSAYPGPYWLVMRTPDVDTSVDAAVRAGGRIARPAEDVKDPQHPKHDNFRAAIVCDPENNFIELYGLKSGGA